MRRILRKVELVKVLEIKEKMVVEYENYLNDIDFLMKF